MRTTRTIGAIGFLVLAAVLPAAGEDAPAPLPRCDFEQGIEGWESLSPAGEVHVSPAPKHVRSGELALEYRYEAKKDAPPFLAYAVAGLAGMESLSLDIQSDSPTQVMVALTEEGGARYQYLTFTPPAQAWMHLEIDRTEFTRADDTPDADGRLDPEQVRAIVLGDVTAILTAEGDPGAKLVGERAGQHSLWIDNLVVSKESAVTPAPAGQVVIDDFRRDNLPWTPLAGVSLAVGPGPGKKAGRALHAAYTTEGGKLAAIIRTLAPGALPGLKKLEFRAAAPRETALAVVLEEAGGARYLASARVPGDGAFHQLSFAYDDFKRAEETKDDNGRLDPEKVKSLGFVDLAGLAGQPPAGAGSLWLQDIRAFVR